MSNIKDAFKNKKAFIPFFTCGDPDLETTKAAVLTAVENGADIIELGIPFSDPTAEGPVIQGANLRALRGSVTTDKIFDFVKELRKTVTVSLIFMTYANVVFSYGADSFFRTCHDIGIDGVILPDLTPIVKTIRQYTDLPCAIGFGISTPEQATTMASVADGVIVGSAIVKFMELYGKLAPKYIGSYIKSMKEAIIFPNSD